MDPHDDDFGPYQEGEDEIAGTHDAPDGFAAAMRAWVKGTPGRHFSPHNGPVGPDLPPRNGARSRVFGTIYQKR